MPEKRRFPLQWIVPSVFGTVLMGSLLAPVSLPQDSSNLFDKAVHAGAYFLFAVSILCALKESGRPRALAGAALIASVHAVCGELLQYFIPYRSCSMFDLCADILGIVTGLLLTSLLQKDISYADAASR